MTEDETTDRAQDRAQEGLVHLQAAAIETIAAARSFLDAIEQLVRDPAAGAAVASLVETVTETVSRVGRPGPPPGDRGDERVERIRVS
jgi:hypothetical protein